MYLADTIVACATPPGRGAVSIIRVSGADAFKLADALTRPRADTPAEAWKLQLSVVSDVSGDPIDDALVVRMPGPRTYTGEDVVEIQCHGSPVVVERIVDAAIVAGARPAQAGEFSRRAVLNGRMDLAQAEAVADLIDARASAGASIAWKHLQGALSHRLAGLRGRIIEVLADVEANVDFSDEELPGEDHPARVEGIVAVCSDIESLLATFALGRRQREGLRVAMTGPPNAGKSSLINALLGEDRMIVSEEPGTTRDSVHETVEVAGIALVLTDTAGVRTTPSAAETAAVARSQAEVGAADFVLLVLDGARALDREDRAILAGVAHRRGLVAINKSDLPSAWDEESRRAVDLLGWPVVATSAVTGDGCEQLRDLLRELAGTVEAELSEPVVVGRVRHRTGLVTARERLIAATELLATEASAELAALELRAAVEALAAITEPLGSEEVLDRVFAEFCLGK